MAIGNPINLTSNIEGKNISVSATAGQTQFTVTGGYRINQISVYRNGVRLVDGRDFTATDGSIVTLLSAASVDDVVEFQVFDDFRVSDALNVNSGGTVNGDVTITGSITGTATTATSLTGSPDIAVTNITAGIITATTFSGNGSALTGVASTDNIITGTAATFTSDVNIADSIIHVGDTNTKIRFPAADTFSVETAGVERLRIDSNGDVGLVGIATATGLVVVAGSGVYAGHTGVVTAVTFDGNVTGNISGGTVAGSTGTFTGDVDIADKIVHTGDTNTAIRFPAADTFSVETGGTERLRITSGGDLLLGHTSVIANMKFGGSGDFGALTEVVNANKGFANGLAILNYDATATVPALLKLATSRSDTVGTNTVVGNSNDNCGGIQFMGNDGTRFIDVARIDGVTDGVVGSNDMPGRLAFFTTADGASIVTERMRIDSSGRLLLGNSAAGGMNGGLLCVGSGQGTNLPSGEHIKIGPSADRIEFLDTNSNASDTGSISIWNTVYNNRSADIELFHPAANTGGIKFSTHNGTSLTERMRILATGGITFNGDTATANALDDYEEGSFTPTASNFSVSGSSTLTGQYVKVGRMVTVGIKFANTGTIAHGVSAFIGGLPFSFASGTEAHGLIGMLVNSNSTAFNSNQSGTQCKMDGEGGNRFFPGSFTTTSSGGQLLFGGTYISVS